MNNPAKALYPSERTELWALFGVRDSGKQGTYLISAQPYRILAPWSSSRGVRRLDHLAERGPGA